MKIFTAMIALMLSAASAIAAPQPKAPIPLEIAFTQGSGASQVIRRLPILGRANCIDFRGTPINGEHGLERFRLICGNTAQASYVQFNTDDGPVYPQWVYAPPPVCAPMPAPVSQTRDCSATNPGTTGTWVQTHGWAAASPQVPPDGCWTTLPWTPVAAPPGACTPAQVGFQWQAPFDIHASPAPARPAKNGTYLSPYGTTIQRVTDFAHDITPPPQWGVSWYNRFQAVNSDGSLIVFYQSDGFWDLYDTRTNAYLKHLNGPAADAEFNWDATRPSLAYYVPTNGGTSIRQIDVVANTNTLYYDFTAAVHALWPDVDHCWTKSEGRTSADGRYIAFQCERDPGGGQNWITRGFVKIDLVTKSIVFSKTNTTGDRPDNTTISPNGLWLVTSYGAPNGTSALATDGSGRTCQLHTTVEHAALGKLTNGHDAIVLPNYTTGNVQAMDIDTCTRLDTSWPAPLSIYNNTWLFNVGGMCRSCAMHPSFNAYRTPGWVLIGFYGPYSAGLTPPANVIALNVETGRYYGVAASYAADLDYWDEAHCSVDPTFTFAWCTENWLGSPSRDVVKITIPPLP